jgi:phosphoribosylformylglycinamidine synthase
MGIPTVGGECEFHPCYNGNILVNAMTVGIADTDKIFYSAAAGLGNPLVYVGSRTGRDGIHGATMASAEFDEDSEEKRPTVQVGDPFTEKRVLEACLELMATDAIVAIQDMGAAGLTCSTFEMASKGGMGVELNLDLVPKRAADMTAYELMLSESQERMVMVLKPGREDEARAIFEKWELEFAVIGHLTDTGRLTLTMGGQVVGDLPIDPLAEASPEYDRPWVPTPAPKALSVDDVPAPNDPMAALKRLVGSPDLCEKRWIWEQYDHMVMGDTVQRPGGDAAVVRVHGTKKALAVTTDCTPRYCVADPREGGRQAVAEAWRNITAVGAKPLAITDCLNFGNPEKPRIMGQLVACIQGMSEACTALDFPVVSGNVSLYNETSGEGIRPTPAIGGVGLARDVTRTVGLALAAGQTLIAIGDTAGHLGQSLYLREIAGREEGAPPPVDLAAERRNGDFVRRLIEAGRVAACHDVSGGGLAVAVAEMAMAGGVGAAVEAPEGALPLHAWLFGEDQARYVLAVTDVAAILADAAAAKVPAAVIGRAGGDALTVNGTLSISLAELKSAHQGWLPEFMSAP